MSSGTLKLAQPTTRFGPSFGQKCTKSYQLIQGSFAPDPLPGALPLDPAGGFAPRAPLQACAACARHSQPPPPFAKSWIRPIDISAFLHFTLTNNTRGHCCNMFVVWLTHRVRYYYLGMW